MTAEATVTAIITDAIADVQDLQDSATSFAEDAQTVASTTLIGGANAPSPTEPDITIPLFVDPDQDLGNEFRSQYANTLADLDAALAADLSSYLSTYFPSLTSCISTFQSWLCNQITNGGTGVNSAVEDALWQRGRDRLQKDQAAEEDGLLEEWAGRGWNMPAPVLADTVARSRQNLAGKLSDLDREIVIKQFDVEVDMTKFAVEKYSSFYLGALDSLRNYLLLTLETPKEARANAAAYVAAKEQLWRGAAAYYNALIQDAALTLDYDKLRIDKALKAYELDLNALVELVKNRTAAAVSSAEALGNIAAARSGALNALAEVSHQTQATE